MTSGSVDVNWIIFGRVVDKIIPWWVGARHRRPDGYHYYWQPLLDSLQERISREIDAISWLQDAPYDEISIALGRKGMPIFEPNVLDAQPREGSADFYLAIPESIADEHDLNRVEDVLFRECMNALEIVGEKLRLGPLPRRVSKPAKADPADPADVTIAGIAKRFTSRPTILVSQRYVQRSRFSDLKGQLIHESAQDIASWELFTLDVDVIDGNSEIECESDFSGISRPLEPQVMAANPENVFLVVSPAVPTLASGREKINAAISIINQYIPTRVNLIGNDSGHTWITAGFGRTRL